MLKHLEQEGAAFANLRYQLDLQFFIPSGLMGPKSTYKRLEYLNQCLVSNTKNTYSLALSKTRKQFAVEAKLTSQ
eukprot:1974157-Ditylum_brightwellii.AAC.1